jgi:beta-lactamase superfamily II metal-dependent hydrolase
VLEIHLIDVGQGDSTLVVASNAATGQQRSMLIDGGITAHGETVYDYLTATAGINALDHMLITHYNEDHGGGLRMILLSDDLSSLVRTLALSGAGSPVGTDRAEDIAGAAAAVFSTAIGNYGANAGRATAAANQAQSRSDPAGTDADAVDVGISAAENRGAPAGVASLIVAPTRRVGAARAAGLAVANGRAAGDTAAALRDRTATAIWGALVTGMQVQNSRFWTGNRYNATHVIDLGNTGMMAAGWDTAITGNFLLSGYAARAPGVGRTRTSVPALGAEVLWNSGPNAMLPPAGAPQAFVISRASQAWQGIGAAPFAIGHGFPDNDTSIGLLIKFNDFYYYTAGDLGSNGEDPLMNAVMHNGLPNPAGGAPLPIPDCMGSFKCSHHGANTSTSAAFLANAQPISALISAGYNASYEHPGDATVTRLANDPNIQLFFLTNCNFASNAVAASQGLDQLATPNNFSRVAGDNNPVNLAPGRHRGDIRVRVLQADSTPVGGRTMRVRYWEPDQAPAGPRTYAFNF